MVLKEGNVIAFGMLMVLLLAVGNSAYFFISAEDSVGLMSGNSIKDVVGDFYATSSMNQRIFILVQFSLVILVIIVILIVIRKFKSKSRLSKRDFVKKGRIGSRTDLDILYEMLKKERVVSIFDIGKVFGVTPEVSVEWAKVLENGGLAVIDYPRFGKPILKLGEEEAKEGEEKEEKNMDEEKEKKCERPGLQKVVLGKDATSKITSKKIDVKKVSKVVTKETEVKKISKRAVKKAEKRRKSDVKKRLAKIDKKIGKVSKRVKKRTKKIKKKQ